MQIIRPEAKYGPFQIILQKGLLLPQCAGTLRCRPPISIPLHQGTRQLPRQHSTCAQLVGGVHQLRELAIWVVHCRGRCLPLRRCHRSALAWVEPRRKEVELQLLAVEHGINIECAFDLLVRKWLILSKVCQPFTPPYSLHALTPPSLSHTYTHTDS